MPEPPVQQQTGWAVGEPRPQPLTQDHVEAVTAKQTTSLTFQGWMQTAVLIGGILLGVVGYKVVPTTPTPVPDAYQQILDVLAKQQAKPTVIVVHPKTALSLDEIKAALADMSKEKK